MIDGFTLTKELVQLKDGFDSSGSPNSLIISDFDRSIWE